jgi:hypothetical protein
MAKFPYISECQLFVQVDYKHADEIIHDYNDFYGYNIAQCNNIYHSVDEILKDDNDNDDGGTEEIDINEKQKIFQAAEHSAKNATEHFQRMFGSKDFGESALFGFEPNWDNLQKVLSDENKRKVPIQESTLNPIAQYLRRVASIVTFAGRIITNLEDIGASDEQISAAKDGFKKLLARAEQEIEIPEYHKTKQQIIKFRKAEQFLAFCEKLFKEI